jgi:copper(I)-binding protein
MKRNPYPSAFIRGCLLFVAVCATAQAAVVARDAWVRGMVPVQHDTVAYMTLTSNEDAKVVGVRSPVARRAHLHASENSGSVMRMQAIEQLPLPADRPVELKPGGTHVMLMDVSHALKPGETVPIEFTIENAKGQRSTLQVKAQVRPLAE